MNTVSHTISRVIETLNIRLPIAHISTILDTQGLGVWRTTVAQEIDRELGNREIEAIVNEMGKSRKVGK